MSNEVTNAKATGLGALSALRSGLTNVRTKLPEVSGSPYLRLLKDGDWVFGQEDNAVASGTEAIINPLSIKHGYSCWTNRTTEEQKEHKSKNEVLGEIMVGLNQPLQAMHQLEQKVDPLTARVCAWKDQIAMDVKFVDGKHKGTQVVFKATSVGGLNAARGVLDAILAKLEEDTEFVCPIIKLSSDSYKHNTYGKTYVPVMEVVGWANLQGEEEDGEDTPALEAPKAVDEKIAETAEAETTDEPVRRRRRV